MADPKGLIDLVGFVVWPIIVGSIAVGFRREIRAFLSSFPGMAGRIRKAGPLEFDVGDQAKATDASKPKEDIGEALKTEPMPSDPSLLPWIENINELIRRNDLTNAPDLQQRLVWTLAWNMRLNEFNNTSKLIFGTQIAALKEIANSGGLTAEALKTIHEEHELRVHEDGKDAPLGFLNWIGFLRDQRLVSMDSQGRYAITPIGVGFLHYATADHVTEARVY